MRRRFRKAIALPASFVPKFWDEADRRSAIVKEIVRRIERIERDTGANSIQKRLLCQRVVFMQLQLETQEREALESGKLDLGVYTQGVNCLIGLLKAVGLEKHVKDVSELRTYLEQAHE